MTNDSSQNLQKVSKFISHYWVASSPFFETSLFFSTAVNTAQISNTPDQGPRPAIYNVVLYDCDGDIVNELKYEASPTEVGILELHNLMEGMKYESGLKHGWVHVESEVPGKAVCRIHARSSACLMGELMQIGPTQRAFFPIRFGEQRTSYIAVVNYSKEPSAVRCKLFIGKRSPEILHAIPPGGARLINLESEFPEYKESAGSLMMGYVRVSPRNDTPFGIQLIERCEGSKEEGLFGTLS